MEYTGVQITDLSGGATYVNTRTICCTNQRINTRTWRIRQIEIFLFFMRTRPLRRRLRSQFS